MPSLGSGRSRTHRTARDDSILGSQAMGISVKGFGRAVSTTFGASGRLHPRFKSQRASIPQVIHQAGRNHFGLRFALASRAMRGDTGRPGLTQRPAEMEAELVRLFLPEPSRLQVQDCA